MSKNPNKIIITLTLVEVIVALIILGLIIGGIIGARDIIKISRLRAQISQIERFDTATADFFDKYEGLPGDLLSVSADREGIVTGDGTPGHSDGDGKISPCNLGWQWNLGCETALFWSQLSATGFISENFSADNGLQNSRLDQVGKIMSPYLPESPLAEDIYVAVWNTDLAQASPAPQLPYGNYYEISKIRGVLEGKMRDDNNALTPTEARAIDDKIDDGSPWSGRVIVNGNANWPYDAWGTLSKPGPDNCVSADHTYNSYEYFKANRPLCHLAIAMRCCAVKKDEE